MNKLALGLRLTGAALLIAALLLVGYNLWDDQRATRQAETTAAAICQMRQENAAEEHFLLPRAEGYQLPFYEEFPDVEMPVLTVDGIDYIGTLDIPILSLTLPVINSWSYDNLRQAPCRYSGSAYRDDLILCGHNYGGHFADLASLEPGTPLQFTDCDGNVFDYGVTELIILQPEDAEALQEGSWDLTLFTCTVGGGQRVAVRCELLK